MSINPSRRACRRTDDLRRPDQIVAPAPPPESNEKAALPVPKAELLAALKADGFELRTKPAESTLPGQEVVYLEDANGELTFAEYGPRLKWVEFHPREKGSADEDKRFTQAATKLASLLLELPPNKIDAEFATAKTKLSSTSANSPPVHYYDGAGKRADLRISNPTRSRLQLPTGATWPANTGLKAGGTPSPLRDF